MDCKYTFRGGDCDSDYYLVVAKVRERLPIKKKEGEKFGVETLNLKRLSDLEVRKLSDQNLKQVCNFGELDNWEYVNRGLENVKRE